MRFAENCDGSVRGAKKAGENSQERGFSGAVFAEENVAAARLEIKRDLTECGKAAEEFGHLGKLRVIGFRVFGLRVLGLREIGTGGIGVNGLG